MAEPVFKVKIPKFRLKGPIIIIAIAAVAVIIFLSTSFIVVDQTENAVITTFGKYTKTLGAGLHYKLPLGIQKAYIVKTKVIQTETFGFRTIKSGAQTQYSDEKFPNESTMLTGDLNIVDVEWIIQYRINDPKAWLFSVSDRQKTIRDISQFRAQQPRRRSSHTGSHRPGPPDDPRQRGDDDEYDIFNYNLGYHRNPGAAAEHRPPAGVQDAFEDVNKAIQDMNRLINEGKEAYNAEIPRRKAKPTSSSRSPRAIRPNASTRPRGDVARFVSVLDEYRKSPDVTRRRLYYEMMNEVFAGSEGVDLIDKSLSNVLPVKVLDGAKEAAR